MRNCTKIGKKADMFENNCNDSQSTSSLLEVSEDRRLHQTLLSYHFTNIIASTFLSVDYIVTIHSQK